MSTIIIHEYDYNFFETVQNSPTKWQCRWQSAVESFAELDRAALLLAGWWHRWIVSERGWAGAASQGAVRMVPEIQRVKQTADARLGDRNAGDWTVLPCARTKLHQRGPFDPGGVKIRASTLSWGVGKKLRFPSNRAAHFFIVVKQI